MTSGEVLAERIVSCLPAASFEMETLCRLTAIVATTEVPTAAIECTVRPRLLINPEFVARHCARDEDLFLLVMHELYHVLLGHTRLFPRVTALENIAFDAVINAGLALQFCRGGTRGFFESLNPADEFPGLLLRPPAGWPHAPVYPGLVGPPGTQGLLRRLYPPPSGDPPQVPTYGEILDLLLEAPPGLPGAFLLGDHEGDEREQRAAEDPAFGDVVRRVVARWPPVPVPRAGRSGGDATSTWEHLPAPPAEAARRAFAVVLRRALAPCPAPQRARVRAVVPATGGLGVLANPRDRLAPCRRALGAPATLWAQPAPLRARVPDDPSRAHVYLDVSGSMAQLLPRLVGLLVSHVAARRARVFQFSTEVAPLPLRKLRAGALHTTFGTDVNPVLEHVLAARTVRRALVVTDGCTGRPRADLAECLQERGVRVHVVLPAESAYRADLREVATSITVLPRLDDAGPTWRL